MTPEDQAALLAAIGELSAQMKPLLLDKSPIVQGGALADLLAIWLAGHFGPPGYRETVLTDFLELVRALVPANERIIVRRMKDGTKDAAT